MNAIDWVNQKYHAKRDFPQFKAGDTINVHVKIKEGEKERVQQFKGVVIAIHKNGPGSTYTVRKVSSGVGVERVFSFSSPAIEKIELVSVGKVRRAKLYYLRELSGKKARIQSVHQGMQPKKVANSTNESAEKEVVVEKADEPKAEESSKESN